MAYIFLPTSDFSMSVGIFLNGRLIRRMAGSSAHTPIRLFSRRVSHSTAMELHKNHIRALEPPRPIYRFFLL